MHQVDPLQAPHGNLAVGAAEISEEACNPAVVSKAPAQDVVEHWQTVDEVEFLPHKPDGPAEVLEVVADHCRDVLAVEEDAPFSDALQTVDGAEQC